MKTNLQKQIVRFSFRLYMVIAIALMPSILRAQVQIGNDIKGTSGNEFLGFNVSISQDGNTVAVAAPGKVNATGQITGAVSIYENVSGVWTQIGSDISGESDNESIIAVSISENGSIVVVGSSDYIAPSGEVPGRIRVFRNQSGNWVQVGEDILGSGDDDSFGLHVDISANGRTISAGAIFSDENGENSGQVKVYDNVGGSWIQIGQTINGLSADDRTSNHALSANGEILAVTSNGNDGENRGVVRIYELNLFVEEWEQIGQNLVGDRTGDLFGANGIDISEDGFTIGIAAAIANTNATGLARIYEFNRSANEWGQIGSDINGDIEIGQLGNGSGLALSPDGQIAVIGVPGSGSTDIGLPRGSLAKIYKNQSGEWIQIGENIVSENDTDFFGWSVSISQNGIAAIGGFGDQSNGPNSGIVAIYDINDIILSTEDFDNNSLAIYPNPTSTTLNIQLENEVEFKSIELYNNLGQKVATSILPTLDVSSFSKGIYLARITTSKGNTTKKVVIN